MENLVFHYIAGYYYLRENKEVVKGGFLSLKAAQEYLEYMDTLGWGPGFAYVDSPEGKYIYGETDWRSFGCRWYEPREWEKALVYDCAKDAVLRIDDAIPIGRYRAIQKQNKSQKGVTG